MSEIQPLLVDLTLEFIDALVAKAVVRVEGIDYEKDIHHSVTKDNTLRKYVLLEEERGHVSRVALVDAKGRELYVKALDYQKGNQGYMVVFPIKQTIEVSQ